MAAAQAGFARRYGYVAPLLLGAAGAVLLVKRDEAATWIAPLMLIALGLSASIERIWAGYAAMDRQWAQSERFRDKVVVETDDDGLWFRSPTWEVRYGWTLFVRFEETANLFLLYHTQQEMSHIVPKRAFATPHDVDAFRAVLERHVTGPARGFPVVTKDAH